MLRYIRSTVLALTAAFAIGACAPTAQNTQQSLAQEQARSEQLVRELDSKGQIIKTRALNTYVRGVVSRVAAVRPKGAVPIKTYIVKDANVNAFTTGGGYVFFNAGMLAALQNEAQVATVAAHEIAHIDRGHIQAGQSQRTGVQLGAALATIGAAVAGVNPNLVQPIVGLGAQAVVSDFSQTQERDADNVGIRYLATAGYNGLQGAKSFAILRELYGDGGGFLSSHPAPSARESSLTQQSKQLGATGGRVGTNAHDRATRSLRREILAFYESSGRNREAALIRRNLR